MMGTVNADPRAMRHAMVASQLRTNAVDDQRVVKAMAELPRELFVPANARVAAYRDTALPAGHGRYINTPLATGRLLTASQLEPSDRVLLIGAAGGYAAALLAEIVADVVAVESSEVLVSLAREALAGIGNVALVEGPLAEGCAERGPFDVLLIDGSVEVLPTSLVEQVRPGGRIVAGLVDKGVTRLAAGRRTAGGYGLQAFADMECVGLPGFEQPRGFQF